MPIHERRHFSEDSTQYPNLTDWLVYCSYLHDLILTYRYHSPRKLTKKKKTGSSGTALSLSQIKSSTMNSQWAIVNNKNIVSVFSFRETLDLSSNRMASADSHRVGYSPSIQFCVMFIYICFIKLESTKN